MKKSDAPNLEGVVPLYISGFYDVPLEGICKYNGETLFFLISGDPLSDGPFEYAVFRLPREQTEFFIQRRLILNGWLARIGRFAKISHSTASVAGQAEKTGGAFMICRNHLTWQTK